MVLRQHLVIRTSNRLAPTQTVDQEHSGQADDHPEAHRLVNEREATLAEQRLNATGNGVNRSNENYQTEQTVRPTHLCDSSFEISQNSLQRVRDATVRPEAWAAIASRWIVVRLAARRPDATSTTRSMSTRT